MFPFNKFWDWYEKHLALNTSVAAFLFFLQIIHLIWLSLHVVSFELFGQILWEPGAFWQNIIILVDYTEIPALFTTSLVYINILRKNGYRLKETLYLSFLNIQFLHIFWITDEFVIEAFTGAGGGTVLPVWLAWVAIMIDYLELPVIFETIKKALLPLR